jgi:CubicO group peptidase (beta-lactamase class C family)
MILDHTIALPTFPNYREVVSTDDPHGFHNLEEIVARIAAAEPMRVPGVQHGYSSKTYGWMVGELVRRITGESLGVFVRKEIAGPLGLDLWVGLPESEHDRVAPMIPDPTMDAEVMQGQEIAGQTIMGRTFFMGDKLLGTVVRETMNHPVFWTAEVPGSGGMATAESLARLFGCLACGGELDGVRIVSEEALRRHSKRRVHGPDAVWGSIFSFGLGFMRPTETLAFGPHDEAFGHPGMGGAVAYADPVDRIGFGFIPNRMIKHQRTDPRWEILGQTLYESLG